LSGAASGKLFGSRIMATSDKDRLPEMAAFHKKLESSFNWSVPEVAEKFAWLIAALEKERRKNKELKSKYPYSAGK